MPAAIVAFLPQPECIGNGSEVRDHGFVFEDILAHSAVEKNVRIVLCVDVQHGNRIFRMAARHVVGAGHAGDGLERTGKLAGYPVRHHAAVRHANGIDFMRVYVHLPRDIRDHLFDEADIIDIVVPGFTAAFVSIPCRQFAGCKRTEPVRKHDDIAGLVGLGYQAVIFISGHIVHVAAAAVE